MLDFTTARAVLKEQYPDAIPPQLGWEDAVFFGLAKKEIQPGELIKQPLVQAGPNAVGADFASVLEVAEDAHSVLQAFKILPVDLYSFATVAGKAMQAARRGGTSAFIDIMDNEIKRAMANLVTHVNKRALRTRSGEMATIASSGVGADPDLTLADPSMALLFEEGMVVKARANGTSTPRTGEALLIAVDADSGTLTTDDNWSTNITDIAETDELFVKGDYVAASDELCISGMGDWNPETAPTGGDDFWGVDRSSNPVKLAGVRYDGSDSGDTLDMIISKAIGRGAGYGCFKGGGRHIGFLNPTDLNTLGNLLNAQTERVKLPAVGFDGKQIASIGYDQIGFRTLTGKVVPFVADPHLEIGTSRICDMDEVYFTFSSSFPAILEEDGLMFMRLAGADGYQCRIGGFGNQRCKRPDRNIFIRLYDL